MEVAIAAPIIVTLIVWLTNLSKKIVEDHSAAHSLLKEANLYQIKATLLFMYRHAKQEDDKVSTQQLDVFNDLHQVYIKLGGNGFIDTIRKKMNAMEVIDD